jgi:hypothetical protein
LDEYDQTGDLQNFAESHIEFAKFEIKKMLSAISLKHMIILCIIKDIENHPEISMIFNFKKNINSEAHCRMFEDHYSVDSDDIAAR